MHTKQAAIKKQKPSAGSSKSPKLSVERMLIVLESLRECPILSRAAEKAGIHRKTLEYWLRCSKAGDDGYDLVWQGVLWRFHEHCASATDEARDHILAILTERAMGVKYPGTEAYVTPPDWKMLRSILALMHPEEYGKRRRVEAADRRPVLVIGAAKKRKYDTAASVQARQWKALSKRCTDANPKD